MDYQHWAWCISLFHYLLFFFLMFSTCDFSACLIFGICFIFPQFQFAFCCKLTL
jgi:hypothetical protein